MTAITLRAMSSSFPAVVPYLYYPDAARAVEFLVRAFGFEEHSVVRDRDGVVWTAQLRTGPDAGSGLVMVGPGMAEFGSHAVTDPDRATGRVHVVVDDLDAHYQRALSEGAVIRSEPAVGFGGMKTYVAGDCGGQQWIFAEPIST